MQFNTSNYLRKATGRAKSDVANKLVSMFLHEISRRVVTAGKLAVTDSSYADAVTAAFGTNCLYCGASLEHDRAAVEHMDGMNRFRLGLHIPGNVAVACNRCNREKRRDDQLIKLTLGRSGWESFLAHDGTRCQAGCKNCHYWSSVHPNPTMLKRHLSETVHRVVEFRRPFAKFIAWNAESKDTIRAKVELLYRECQDFATSRIAALTGEVALDFTDLGSA